MNWFLAQARPRRLRTMRRFAEEEVVIPDGPFAGRRFRCSRQPYTGLWFDQVDSGKWRRCVATGPTQSGKTLACFVIPLLYHLFEVGETVICGVPDMDMAADKWRLDILPVIERSKFKDLLPTTGGGSRGARVVDAILFNNGAVLKFMSGGGSDKSRAGFTARVVVITETDGMDKPGITSRESDKVTQLEARTRAYGGRRRVYMECTVSTERGRTWQEYSNGTKSNLLLPCPCCHAWVLPEREHLTGWQGAESQQAARELALFACPSCGSCWDDAQRIKANLGARVVHEGQTVDELGTVGGDPPATDTLGFRWSGVHNLFLTPGDLAADEWRASRAADEESAEREMRQFVWCLPVVPASLSQTHLEVHELASRAMEPARGLVPHTATKVTVGIDLGKYLCHWSAVAWSSGATGHVLDYGRMEVPSADLGVEQALLVTLRQFKELILAGWPVAGSDGLVSSSVPRLVPELVLVDAGYTTSVVYAFCRQTGPRFMPAVGRGAGQHKPGVQDRTSQTGSVVKLIGEAYHAAWLPSEQINLVETDADHWKTWVHQRLATPVGSPGAMTLYKPAVPQEHLSFCKHLTAESKVEEFIVGKGVVTRWERIRKQNHWLDSTYNACVAGHGVGIRLVEEAVKPPPPRDTTPRIEPEDFLRTRPKWLDRDRPGWTKW